MFIVMYYVLKRGDILSYVIIGNVVVNKTRKVLAIFCGLGKHDNAIETL
jgi:hypothetical protein